MKYIKDIKIKLEWEKYYNPDFDWNDYKFYSNNILSEDFIREFKDKVDWSAICRYQKLSEEFIEEFQDKLYWKHISGYQELSVEFIKKFRHKIDWELLSCSKYIDEDTLRKFQYSIDWDRVSRFAEFRFLTDKQLSEKFIEEFQNKLDLSQIFSLPYLSEKFKEKIYESQKQPMKKCIRMLNKLFHKLLLFFYSFRYDLKEEQ